jgi:Xaa-Pro aminopeptidase
MTVSDRLYKLREKMKAQKLDVFLVPQGDEYQNEFVPDYLRRLQWLTNFSGSAGMAIIGLEHAIVLSDGRYSVQLRQEVDPSLYEVGDSVSESVSSWIKKRVKALSIGFDARLHSKNFIDQLQRDLSNTPLQFQALDKNLIDDIWQQEKTFEHESVVAFSDEIAGRSAQEKLKLLAGHLQTQGLDSFVITQLDSVAWMLNVRGRDVPHNPVILSKAILYANGRCDWFVEPQKLTPAIITLLKDFVSFYNEDECEKRISDLKDKKVGLDTLRSSLWYFNRLQECGAQIVPAKDPVIDIRACKTSQEIEGMRQAHIKDGVAMVRFLTALSELDVTQETEMSLDQRLLDQRRRDFDFRDTSFETICGWQDHGAIIHYRAIPQTAHNLSHTGVLLLDSGGQYKMGTTDITRTLGFGALSAEIKRNFTLVLKGHIALSMAQFPQGTTGAQLDILARQPLWQEGLDYAHGTGHGVGCYLSVHEEATSLSPRSKEAVKAGMVLSNEPGFYKEGHYGIRIENLILCVDTGQTYFDGRAKLAFETLTLCPYDRNLIDVDLLTRSELDWLNQYHKKVFDILSDFLNDSERRWLQDATQVL